VVGTLPQYALESSITNKFWYGFEHGPQRAQAKVTDCNVPKLGKLVSLAGPFTSHCSHRDSAGISSGCILISRAAGCKYEA
jgi:hypothetical protein